MGIEYQLSQYSATVRDAYLNLLPQQEQAVTGGKLEWKFRDNPSGPGLIALGRSGGGDVLGVNAFMPASFQFGLEKVVGYQSMDTIVSAAARGQGVFNNLVECFYRESGAELLYGFPNLSSSPGFFGRLGWQYFGPVPMLFRPLRAGYFLKKLSRNLPDFGIPLLARPIERAERFSTFDASATNAWRQFSTGIGCAVERSAEYLNWRLSNHPVTEYTRLKVADGSFVAFSVAEKHGGSIGYLMEAIGVGESLPGLISLALHEMKEARADAALAWCLPWSPNYAAYRKAGFYPLPEKLRPVRINFGGRVLRDHAAAAKQPKNWYVSYLDSDTV